jgi:hypothetical protein
MALRNVYLESIINRIIPENEKNNSAQANISNNILHNMSLLTSCKWTGVTLGTNRNTKISLKSQVFRK